MIEISHLLKQSERAAFLTEINSETFTPIMKLLDLF